jgi:hypothetical protein
MDNARSHALGRSIGEAVAAPPLSDIGDDGPAAFESRLNAHCAP